MMRAFSSLVLLATAASAQQVAPAPDALRVELSPLDGTVLQITVTNMAGDHFYMQDPTDALANPQEDTYRFVTEPAPGAARFHGMVRGSLTVSANMNEAGGDWDRLHRWKEVALNAVRVPANGGSVTFNVTPTDHVEFSAPGDYTLSMGLTLVALSPDRSQIRHHHVSTNAVNVTTDVPTSPDHNEQISRRSLQGGSDLSCSPRQKLLVDAWVQQALFSVKDAKTEALGGQFHTMYKDDIDMCFGPKLTAAHQKYISDGLAQLEDLLDPKGAAKFAAFCDVSNASPGCQADGTDKKAEAWFKTTGKQTDVTLCGSFFYSPSHCAYKYKSATNSLSGLLVRSLGISKPLPRERMEPLLPDVETQYNPAANINKLLSADERTKFYPSWECFLARKSKDEVINSDACNADEQVSAGTLSAGLLQDEIVNDANEIVGEAESSRRMLEEMEFDSDGTQRRKLAIAKRMINTPHDTEEAIAEITERPVTTITTPWGAAMKSSPVVAFVHGRFLSKKKIVLDGRDNEVNELAVSATSPTCELIAKELNLQARSGNLNQLQGALTGILSEAAGTGVFDLSSPNRQKGKLVKLAKALAGLRDRALKLKVAFGLATTKTPPCDFSALNRAAQVMAALAPGNKIVAPTEKWTIAEPYAMALARATVVTLLGALFHDYSKDFDLSGDELMNIVIYRLNTASQTYRNQIFETLTRAYSTVLRVASALTLGSTGQTEKQFNDLGLHMLFAPSNIAEGRTLLDGLMTSIHAYYDGTTAQLADIAVPAIIDSEFDLLTLVKRKQRQEVRELTSTQWLDYKNGIKALMASGEYAKFIYTHHRYFPSFQLHLNPRFLPWHRAFLITFDEKLSLALGKPFRAPYWDWTTDGHPLKSKLFTPAYYGSPGTGATDVKAAVPDPTHGGEFPGTARSGSCVATGHDFSVIKNYRDHPNYNDVGFTQAPHDRCLTRGDGSYLPSDITEPSQKTVDQMLKLSHDPNNFQGSFALQMEYSLHNTIHRNMEGDMSETGSPADPIFWSHHAMIDNVWYEWQRRQGDVQNKYTTTDFIYKDQINPRTGAVYDQGVFDVVNEGFKSGTTLGAAGTPITDGTKRDFAPGDKMVFLEPKFQHKPDPKDTRWTVSELLEASYMYRTFQYNKKKYAKVSTPSATGLTTT